MLSRAALRQLMGQAASAGSLHAVYESALRGVLETLDIERASLLVFDDRGTMRFVAWAGLSESYRRAVDGHSPWSVDETAATPLTVCDVETDPSLAMYLPVFRHESIRALAFVPLQFGVRLLGKFMLYYREPHTFSDAEIATAQQIADHVAFALEHHRIAAALESRLVGERDLRQLAETEATLRQANERRLSLALSAGGMGAWEWDIRSDQVSWSSELEVIHGIEPGTFEGTLEAFRRDVHPADADRLRDAIAAALVSPRSQYEIEYRIVPPSGSVRWLAATGRVIVDSSGRPERMVGICRDITEHKRTVDARAFLADASRILATTLAPEAILKNLARLAVPTLADWCIVQAIDATGHLYPVEIANREGERTALMWDFLQSWPSRPDLPNSAAVVAQTSESMLIRRVTDEMLQTRAQHDEKQLHRLREMGLHSAMTVPLRARDRTLGTLTLMSAESERLYDEADLRVAEDFASRAAFAIDNAQLYRQAEDARLEAERARAQLEAAIQSRDEMVAFVSHDLRDPLQAMAAATDALRRQPQTAETSESLESIALAITQMRGLVEDLLDVSLLEAGRLPIHREQVDLTDLILSVQTLLLPRIKASGARVETSLPSNLPLASIDRHRILQVLVNLVGNALKFGASGGLVTLSAERQPDAIRVRVHDTGAGIRAEHLDRVFDRFWRADRRAGAGLGLAVAKGIVEAHGGRIGVTSQPGTGTTFFFTLPLPSLPVVSPARDRLSDERGRVEDGRRQRVLVVDDNRNVAQSLARLVRALGHDVHVAFSGEEALEVAEKHQPQIILMDIDLPGLNGFETATEIRSRPWGEGIALVAVSGLGRDGDRRRAIEAGFSRHLTKPIDAGELQALLNGSSDGPYRADVALA